LRAGWVLSTPNPIRHANTGFFGGD
jgi:hypothetical protein